MVSRLLFLAALCAAGLSVVPPVEANGGVVHPFPGILFPDCHLCPAPAPEPRQDARLADAPESYVPGRIHEMALEVTPFGGPVSRFVLTVDRGTLEAAGENARVVSYSELVRVTGVQVVQDFPVLTYTRPEAGLHPAWRFRWAAPPVGSGPAVFSFYVMSGQEGDVAQKGAWRFYQVQIPEGSGSVPPPASPSPPASPAGLVPAGLPEPPSPPPSQPGFGAAVAVAAAMVAALLMPARRGRGGCG